MKDLGCYGQGGKTAGIGWKDILFGYWKRRGIIAPLFVIISFCRKRIRNVYAGQKLVRIRFAVVRACGIRTNRLIFEHDIVRREVWDEEAIGEVVWSDIGLTGFFLEVADKNKKGVSHSYPISRGRFDDDEWNVNTDEVIGNVFDCPIC